MNIHAACLAIVVALGATQSLANTQSCNSTSNVNFGGYHCADEGTGGTEQEARTAAWGQMVAWMFAQTSTTCAYCSATMQCEADLDVRPGQLASASWFDPNDAQWHAQYCFTGGYYRLICRDC